MPDVWLGVLNRFVEKYLNVKGGPTVVDFNHQVTLEIPVLIGVEERYHQGWSRFFAGVGVTGGAAQNGGLELHNPLTSNAIAVVERIAFRNVATTSGPVSVTFQGGPAGIGDLPSTVTPGNLDGRSTVGSSMITTSSTSAVGFVRTIFFGAGMNAQEYQFIQTENQELTLIPGSAVLIVDNTVANAAQFSMIWRERALETSELT